MAFKVSAVDITGIHLAALGPSRQLSATGFTLFDALGEARRSNFRD